MPKPPPQTQQIISTVVVSRPGIMQQSLRAALAAYPWLSVMASAGDGLTALNQVAHHQPGLLVIDSNLLAEEAEALLAAVKVKAPEIRCLVLVRSSQQAERLRAAGADAVLLRQASNQQLHQTLDRLRSRPKPVNQTAPIQTVLLVDDDANILLVLETIFKRTRPEFIILTAENGKNAWEQYQTHQPDLLWTDYRMPDLNGASLISRVRQVSPEIPVVLMTGYGGSIAADLSGLLNIHYLDKPFTPKQVQDLIRTLISD